MKKNILGIIIMGLIITITGCSPVESGQSSAPEPEKNTVLIEDYQFQPAEITIQKGEAITWIYKDAVGHTATGKSFDSGLLNQDQLYKQTFNEAGTFDYLCTPHPYMKGKVIVQ
ncbi:cupredoxin family copper-binding protein [Dehalobacter sp. DCM]|uniref:cupredoxin domain-containing protein n=1 Tax=Dehalobacter sp. DCM TaxID=2907827 RepID=UPI003081B6B5|nr:cupredoxin family copper-binding protein [Dehalobacter sp. DCM]